MSDPINAIAFESRETKRGNWRAYIVDPTQMSGEEGEKKAKVLFSCPMNLKTKADADNLGNFVVNGKLDGMHAKVQDAERKATEAATEVTSLRRHLRDERARLADAERRLQSTGLVPLGMLITLIGGIVAGYWMTVAEVFPL